MNDQFSMASTFLFQKQRRRRRLKFIGCWFSSDIDPGDTLGLPEGKPRAKEALTMGIKILASFRR
jgi:hypothetical protein